MPFILRIQSYRDQPPPTPISKRFDMTGGSIGRTADNDLVLQDPGKYISRAHARIIFRDGGYFIADLGSNPSLVNDRPLGAGREAPLANGDWLTIGDYLLEVIVQPDATPGSDAAMPGALDAASKPVLLPVFQPPPKPQVQPLPPLMPQAQSQPQPQSPSGLRATDMLSSARILDVVDGFADPAARNNPDPLGLNLFGNARQEQPGAFRGTESDHVSPEIQAFPASPMAIPDDYDPLADYRPVAPAVNVNAAPVAARPQHAPAVQPTSGSDSEILQALLKGLGLPDLTFNRSGPELAELVGTMLREAMSGTMGVLVARSMTKRESRIEMTMIAPQFNNPLKFFPDAESALKQMLTNELAGYMPPIKSIATAFDDLKAHELAMMAGMRAALAGVLHRFDPAVIEERIKANGVLDMMLAANRKAKMWDRLVDLYGDISREADDDFQRLFGEKFSNAYEEQVERLRRGRK